MYSKVYERRPLLYSGVSIGTFPCSPVWSWKRWQKIIVKDAVHVMENASRVVNVPASQVNCADNASAASPI